MGSQLVANIRLENAQLNGSVRPSKIGSKSDSKKFAYDGFKMSAITRQKRFEGLFGVYYDKPLKEVGYRNKQIEQKVGKMQHQIQTYNENLYKIQETIDEAF